MDQAEAIALAAALESEFDQLWSRLDALSKVEGREQLEQATNDFLDELPKLLAGAVAVDLTGTTWRMLLASHFARGVASQAGFRPTAGLIPEARAYKNVELTGALSEAVNGLSKTKQSIAVRSEALSKVLKGHIVQDLRDALVDKEHVSEESLRETIVAEKRKLSDLAKNKRVLRQVESQTELAKGYGIFSVQQQPTFLETIPFQELYRAEVRAVWRGWPKRWSSRGGAFFPGVSDYPEGRMIAEISSNIWRELSDPDIFSDGTGQPYPPFAWNSGMSVRPVGRKEAARLGLLGVHRKTNPKVLDFNASLQFRADFDDDIKSVLLDSLRNWEESKGEIVHEKA